ncbi:luciferase family protein [Halomarina salina]|uniref:Luciferase family protein n=1 Tax=Halomarina salina TaxID=1872699 RepID=A0ABD5RI75_9EURY|nr:luciferase family protein [Halomarina salina]
MTDIVTTVSSWPGVSVAPHRFGGREFTVGGREFGHDHGTRQVDLPLTKRVRDVLVAEGATDSHHLFPESGWVSYYLDGGSESGALRLLRIAYLHHVASLKRRATKRGESLGPLDAVDVAAELDALDPSDDLRDAFGPVPA